VIARSLGILALAFAGCVHAQLPARLEIHYEVQRNGSTVAEITGVLEQAGGNYRLTETWKGRGLYALLGRAKRTSEGAIAADGPRPREFVDERSGRDTARVWFDWGAKTLTMRYKGREHREPMLPNAQDRVSFGFALALAPASTQRMDFHLYDGRGVSHHFYEFAGSERVRTPAGEFTARKVVRGSGEERTEIWLAAELGHLPVRMLAVEQGGTQYDQVATRISKQ
jgi:hypothetical protein